MAIAIAVLGAESHPAVAQPVDLDALVNVPDTALRKCIEEHLEKSEGEPINGREMETLGYLNCEERGIVSLAGIEYAENLSTFLAAMNQIYNLTPLAQLTSLRVLGLSDNHITDLEPLTNLIALNQLFLSNNGIFDLAPLAETTSLARLFVGGNYIDDLTPMSNLTNLSDFGFGNNPVSDLSPLKNLLALSFIGLSETEVTDLGPLMSLTELERIFLQANQISDLTALVSNIEINEGDQLYLYENPLSYKAVNEDIPELLRRGVEVVFDAPDQTPEGATSVEFIDAALEQAIRKRLGKGPGWPIFDQELARLSGLSLADRGIRDLAGLEFATGLRKLDISSNQVADLGPLSGLTLLQALWLSGNPVSNILPISELQSLRWLTLDNTSINDLTSLANLPNLRLLALDGNALRDVSALRDASGLEHLSLGDNRLRDIDALGSLSELTRLSLNGNSISSLEPVASLRNLKHLNINDNAVGDLTPLEGHHELEELLARNNLVSSLSPLRAGRLAVVDLQGNPLDGDAIAHAQVLRQSGATMLLGHVVPYFPAAGHSREGFVRVINHSPEGAEVSIRAVDDAGEPFGPVQLQLGPLEAKHINSRNLERGNAAKGLSIGTGAPTKGDWRLELTSPLDIEALAYVRTEDGFVTAMHDVATESILPFFNPGANATQRSILRVVNTEAEPAKWLTGGHDDNGAWWAMPNAVLVRPGHVVTVTAQTLEEVHGLGDGAGKWRLRVPRWPWLAMSLLESPSGHLANLSTAPANTERLVDGRTKHHVPLFLAAGGAREGFVRVINHSAQTGEVRIEGIDDAGNRFGPVRLNVPGRKTVHFNSRDLQNGNPNKGLFGGLGTGDGDWRLALTTALDLQVLAYVRTADGFVTAMHDLAPLAEDGGHRVGFFNPGRNTAQVSKLRLMNDGGEAAQVTIAGIDDEGTPSGTVALTLAGRRALTFTAAQLEAGGEGISGGLGDGMGKWRLRVHSDAPLAVMSLLESPTGHLANLSTGTATVGRSPWPASVKLAAQP